MFRGLKIFLLVGAASAMCAVAPAAAEAACGTSPLAACGLNVGSQDQTFTGTLVPPSLNQWYVFYGTQGTVINTTITDEEDPACSGAGFTTGCGFVTDSLYEDPGVAIGGAQGVSDPSGGQTESISASVRLPKTGSYYLKLDGVPTQSTTGAEENLPFQLVVSASRALRWPPPVQCIVPRLYGVREAAARQALVAAHCDVGTVNHIYSSRLKAGEVLTADAARGSTHTKGYPVALTVSRGRLQQRPK